MKELKYKRTWCEYLDRCPYNPDIMMGSFECLYDCGHALNKDTHEKIVKGKNFLSCITEGTIICNKE